jgi:acetyl esterase/lipase
MVPLGLLVQGVVWLLRNIRSVAQMKWAASGRGGWLDDRVTVVQFSSAATASQCLEVTHALPAAAGPPRPVIVWVHGGGWRSGSRGEYRPLTRVLHDETGAVVVNVDYRKSPAAPMATMVRTVDEALRWTQDNIAKFGGDPKRVTLSGHSAGAHLCLAHGVLAAFARAGVPLPAALHDAATDAPPPAATAAWPKAPLAPRLHASVNQLVADLGTAPRGHKLLLFGGVYDMPAQAQYWAGLGRPSGPLCVATGGQWGAMSPTLLLSAPSADDAAVARELPTVRLVHGDCDSVVQIEQSRRLVKVWPAAAAAAVLEEDAGRGHSDCIMYPLVDRSAVTVRTFRAAVNAA